MKNIGIIVSLIVLFVVPGFGQKSIIYGTVATNLDYKYAYLYDSDTKIFVTAPIIDYQFNFCLDKPEKLKILILSFNTELMKTYKQILESPDYKYPNGGRMLALEDTVEVTLKEYAKNAEVKGKNLNKAIDDMYAAIKSRKFNVFFEQYSDSPVAIVFLDSLTGIALSGSYLFTIDQWKQSYNKLSNRLKNSDEGKELLKSITK